MQHFMEVHMKKFLDLKTLKFGVWGLKTSLGQFWPKAFGKVLIKPLVQNPSCNFHKQVVIFSRIMTLSEWNHESHKTSWPWGLGPRNYIWFNWAQKTNPAVSPEPWLQFSQTGPHFLQNHNMNPIKLWNFKKFHDLGVWGLETTFGRLGPERHI